jgi:hypothetical protein
MEWEKHDIEKEDHSFQYDGNPYDFIRESIIY